MSKELERQRRNAAWSGANAGFIESLYETYLEDPGQVSAEWRAHFDALPAVNGHEAPDAAHRKLQQELQHRTSSRRGGVTTLSAGAAAKQAAVLRIINAYRVRGHQAANLDPLHLRAAPRIADLSLDYHGLDEADLDQPFNTGSLFAPERLKLREIMELVQTVYTGTVGSEYMHITSTTEKRWIQQRLESYQARPELENTDRLWLLQLLTAAEGLEKYLHTKYVGQKRFSLEGGESLIPLLDELIQRAGRHGVNEVVIGMAHRGRLNVLTNILGKPPAKVFDEFEGKHANRGLMTSGDVKYHMGFSSDVDTAGGSVHITLGFNPSHLEIIGPVVEGSVRARQRRRLDLSGDQVMPIVLHGDAAFAGQGVVMETFNISQARGYHTGGTVHIVINNQIGFTTSNPLDSRSTTYCTDVAKMVQAPIFHVNGDDPEAVLFVTRMALDFRNRFHRDVVIDLLCYRRHGHNEADEPAVTQPKMYEKIRSHLPVRAIYAEKLLAAGVIEPDHAQALIADYRDRLDNNQVLCRPRAEHVEHVYKVDWLAFDNIPWDHPCDTGLAPEKLSVLAERALNIPDDFTLHPRVQRIMDDRRKMAAGDQLVDWGFAEIMAYASLLDAGFPVRLSGQDVRRGTFFHRHAMVRDQISGRSYTSLQHIHPDQTHFVAIDSVLSEEAVLAFEYGYATAEPNAMTLWEAQFGDFANGAQVVIDQFIASGGSKWGLYCGLVMLLPHGYEGQGPEHSSARIERYMQLCAEHNMQVCMPSNAAQIFHLLRRQMLRQFRRPLIVMTPKSLLRNPLATSPLDALTHGRFEPVLEEVDALDASAVTQVVMCAGKVYYDLLQARRSRNLEHVAIIRIEQLYPFPRDDFEAMVDNYPNANQYVWCQEEPQNQGAWDQIKHRFHTLLGRGKKLFFAGRPVAAAPATGYYQQHMEEQQRLVDEALSGNFDTSMNRRMNL